MKPGRPSERITVLDAINVVSKKYQLTKDDESRLTMANDLVRACQVLGVINDQGEIVRRRIQGTRVLDIACGNGMDSHLMKQAPIPANMRRIMEPWLCRTMAHLGAQVTGIDHQLPRYQRKEKSGKIEFRGFQDPEWKFVQRDLTQEDAIGPDTFPDGTFDLVHCKNFIGNDIEVCDDPSNQILKREDTEKYMKIKARILESAMRVLKPNGKLIWNRSTYQK